MIRITQKSLAMLTIFLSMEAHSKEALQLAVFDNSTSKICSKILTYVYKQAGIKVDFVLLPAARATTEARLGKIDGEVARNAHYADNFKTLIRIDPPLCIKTRYVLSHKSLIKKIVTAEDLKKYSIGYVRGMTGIAELLKNSPNATPLRDSKTLIEVLKRNRIQVAIDTTEESDINFLLKNDQDISWKIFEKVSIHHYLHIKNKELAPIISNNIEKLKNTKQLSKMCKGIQ